MWCLCLFVQFLSVLCLFSLLMQITVALIKIAPSEYSSKYISYHVLTQCSSLHLVTEYLFDYFSTKYNICRIVSNMACASKLLSKAKDNRKNSNWT